MAKEKTAYAVVGTKLSSGIYVSAIASNWFLEGRKFYMYPPTKMPKKDAARVLMKKYDPAPSWEKFKVYKIYKAEIRECYLVQLLAFLNQRLCTNTFIYLFQDDLMKQRLLPNTILDIARTKALVLMRGQ